MSPALVIALLVVAVAVALLALHRQRDRARRAYGPRGVGEALARGREKLRDGEDEAEPLP